MISWSGIPNPVKAVAAILVLWALLSFTYFAFFIGADSGPAVGLALIGLLKGLFLLAMAYGVLSLQEVWRLFTVVIALMGMVAHPLYFLGTVLSSGFAEFVSLTSGISSLPLLRLLLATFFLTSSYVYYGLSRSSVRRVFGARGQAQTLPEPESG